MSEVNNELDVLKARAKQLGINHHPSIGVAALRERIDAALNDKPMPAETVEPVEVPAVEQGYPDPLAPPKESIPQRNARLRREAERLIRVNISCMNPTKKDYEGEIFTVSNSAIGTIKKYVPFNTEDGFHVPAAILKIIEARKCQIFVKGKGLRGNTTSRGKLIKEFAVERLDPLTPEELSDLATQQAMSGSIG